MDWILIISSRDLGLELGTSDQLLEVLGQLPRDATVSKALQFAAALGCDREHRYRTVDSLLLADAPEDLRARIAALRARNPQEDGFVFFEPWQQLLLASHAARWAATSPGGVELHTLEGRSLFLEACRIINDLSMPPAPDLVGEPIADALIAAAHSIPRLWLLNPPDPNDAQARLLSFLEVVPQNHPEHAAAANLLKERFRDELGVSFEDAIDITAFLAYWSLSNSVENALRDEKVLRVFPEMWLRQTTIPTATMMTFLERVARPARDITVERQPGAGDPWFDPLPFRDRPLVRFDDGSFLVTMPELLMEKAGFDMLWWLTAGPRGGAQARPWQQAFGELCETYVLDLVSELEGPGFCRNVKWYGGELDALSWHGDRLAVFEVSSGFLVNAMKMSGRHEVLRDALERRYVEARQPGGGVKLEAVAQLARDIEWLARCRRDGTAVGPPLRQIEAIHPVIVAADRAVRTQGVWRYLDSELRRRLPDALPWQVAPLAVLGLEDLEWVEQASRERHPRLGGVLPPLLQTLRWWQFDVSRYRAYWQLLEDVFGKPNRNQRLRELFEQRAERMRSRFSGPATGT